MLRSGVLSRSSLAFAPRPFACSIRCKQDEVEDIQTKLIREKATRKKYNKKTNQALGRPYNYAWRFPTLRFNKALHDEMRVLIKDQRWDQLNERWTLLRKIGKHPTPHTVEMLVDALAQSQQVDRAPAVIQTLDNDTNRITANTWRHLAAGYLQANQLEQALEAINSLTNEYPDELPHDARTYGSFVSYFMRHGEQENAQTWMKEFQEREQKFVDPRDLLAFVQEFSPELLRERESDIIELLASTGVDQSTLYDVLAYRFALAGCVDDVRGILEKVKSQESGQDQAEIYDSLILAQTKSGQLDDALSTLDEMRQQGMEICVASYNDILRYCAEQKRDEDVQRILYEMDREVSG